MKYISLFEKFESTKLSKVLGYISKTDRNLFLSELKDLSKLEDIEMSKLSDEMFTYLPYQSGIKVKSKTEMISCPDCSGEGKIKKPWGTEGNRGFHYRYLPCKRCGEEGKISPNRGKITDIKFWFNTEQKYLGKTCVNGTERNLDNRFDLYTEVKPLGHNEVMELSTGTEIKINIGTVLVATIFKDTSGRVYAIQNTRTSNWTPNSSEWKKYGSQYWRIDGFSYRGAYLLKRKSKQKEDPLDWNFAVSIGGGRIVTSMHPVKEIVKDAEFCLILNLEKLFKLKESPRSTISDSRKKRIGVKKSNDDIRNENIQRYINKLASNFEVSKEISDVSKIVPRLFGWSNSFFFVYRELNFHTMNGIINAYFNIFKNIDDEMAIKIHKSDIKSYLQDGYNRTSIYYQKISDSVKIIKSECSKEVLESMNLFNELGSTINEKILKTKIETLGDFELIMYKLSIIRSMMLSNRYNIRHLDYVLRKLDTDPRSLKNAMEENITYIPQINKDLKSIIQSVNKM